MIWAFSSAFVASWIQHGANGKCHCELAPTLAGREHNFPPPPPPPNDICTSLKWTFGMPSSSLIGGFLEREQSNSCGHHVEASETTGLFQPHYLLSLACALHILNSANEQQQFAKKKKMASQRLEGHRTIRSNYVCIPQTEWHLAERSREIPSLNLPNLWLLALFYIG